MSVTVFKGQSSLFKNVPDSRLSEGVVYSETHQRYYWIDVYKALIFSIRSDKSDFKQIAIKSKNYMFPERVGCVIPSYDNADVVYFGGKYGLAKADFATGKWDYECLYSSSSLQRDWDRMRSNDGNSDPNNKSIIYIGIMNDFHVGDCTLEGAVMKFNIGSTTTCECVYDGIRIPNSINFVGNKTIYLTDSLNFQILEIPYSSKDWTKDAVSKIDIKANNQEFDSPEPDGSFILENKYFITAVWSTSKVQVYSLNDYALLQEYLISGIERISCCCLGAEDNEILVTTASKTIDEAGTTSENLNGAVFKVKLKELSYNLGEHKKDGKTHV